MAQAGTPPCCTGSAPGRHGKLAFLRGGRRGSPATHIREANMAITIDDRGGRRGNGWRIAGWGAAATLLLTPLVAMQFTREVNWTGFDFAFMGAMLGGVGLVVEWAFRKSGSTAYRMAVCLALAAIFFLLVIYGAVGVIGSEQEDANLLFGGVFFVVVSGA